LHEAYHAAGLRIIAVNAWDESKEMVREFVEKNGLPYTVLLAGGDVFEKSYRGLSIPTTYLLDRTGHIIDVHHGWGPGDQDLIAKKVEKALQQ
jgi:peroxiredoxin